MKTAIYQHSSIASSQIKKPQHAKCPRGLWSFTILQRSKAKPGDPTNVKTPINEKHLSKILPIYQRLASSELLERCLHCHTQNANESLHSMIWSKCPKEIFFHKQRVNRSVAQSISEYNLGVVYSNTETQKCLGLTIGNVTLRLLNMLQLRKQLFRKRRNTAKMQKARKLIKRAIAKRERLLKKKELPAFRKTTNLLVPDVQVCRDTDANVPSTSIDVPEEATKPPPKKIKN
ncbi:hypothetical protein AVEN_59583-1 [Araneus ventricosus]|uniref:Uncharacterized protein n=1 Tax=Araneus ventricosus TaxID=182803 RepID=A0A4Y2RQX0_ARAVE|nr:hypothetical protein AVEN_59583-1 [Araneus ventricosus]